MDKKFLKERLEQSKIIIKKVKELINLIKNFIKSFKNKKEVNK